MNNSVISSVKAALAARKDKADYPEWSTEDVVAEGKLTHGTLLECFEANLSAVHGIAMHSIQEVGGYLSKAGHHHGYCAPELVEFIETEKLGDGITVSTRYDEEGYDSYAFGITRATAAIAESGTIILRDGETSCRLGALTPWVHIAVVEKASILRTVGDAIASLGDDPNVIWVTGPSKTADVEGILIEGVHGPGVQIALII